MNNFYRNILIFIITKNSVGLMNKRVKTCIFKNNYMLHYKLTFDTFTNNDTSFPLYFEMLSFSYAKNITDQPYSIVDEPLKKGRFITDVYNEIRKLKMEIIKVQPWLLNATFIFSSQEFALFSRNWEPIKVMIRTNKTINDNEEISN